MEFKKIIELDGIVFEVSGEYEQDNLLPEVSEGADPVDFSCDIEIDISEVTAYIPYNDTQVAVNGDVILNFSDRWEELEEKIREEFQKRN